MKIIYFIVGYMSAVVAHSFIYDMVKHRNNRNVYNLIALAYFTYVSVINVWLLIGG